MRCTFLGSQKNILWCFYQLLKLVCFFRPELPEIQKIGTAASKVLRKVIALKILEYACVKDKLSKGLF